jgi:YidC/Oxa1 family membrane protein insertase
LEELWNGLLDGMGTILSFFYAGIPSYGVAIIGLTVAVRLLLFPLTAKQARSMQKMQEIQPEIKRIQARYKDDRQKLNEEIMKYYKENKVNPLAGCLPLVAQMPVFFALFAVLRSPHRHVPPETKLYQAFCGTAEAATCKPKGLGFLGMDLSRAASNPHSGFTDALPYFVLIALVVVTGYLQFKQTQARQGPNTNPQAQMMGKIFPLMFAFISFSLPAGVVLYFLVSNMWQIGQQALIYGTITGASPSADQAEAKGGAAPAKDGKAGGGPERRPEPKPPATEKPRPPATGRTGDGLGRAQPSGSRPRPRKRRR